MMDDVLLFGLGKKVLAYSNADQAVSTVFEHPNAKYVCSLLPTEKGLLVGSDVDVRNARTGKTEIEIPEQAAYLLMHNGRAMVFAGRYRGNLLYVDDGSVALEIGNNLARPVDNDHHYTAIARANGRTFVLNRRIYELDTSGNNGWKSKSRGAVNERRLCSHPRPVVWNDRLYDLTYETDPLSTRGPKLSRSLDGAEIARFPSTGPIGFVRYITASEDGDIYFVSEDAKVVKIFIEPQLMKRTPDRIDNERPVARIIKDGQVLRSNPIVVVKRQELERLVA